MTRIQTLRANIQNNNRVITAKVQSYTSATTSKEGIIRIATDAEASSGISTNTAITPHTLRNAIVIINASINDINAILSSYGNIVTHDVSEFATSLQGTLADSALQPNDNISELINDVGYITSASVGDGILTIQKNGSNIDTFSANASEDKTVNIIVPTKISDLDNDVVNDATLIIQKNGNNVGTFTSNSSTDTTINLSIPVSASDVNALPDSTKYGNSIDVILDTTDYKMTIALKDQDGTTLNSKVVDFPLESVVVNGSYNNVDKEIILTLQNGNTVDIPVGDLVSGLQSEITSNNKLSSDLVDDTSSTNKFVTTSDKTTWNGKQDAISDLETIRNGASKGATSVQPNDNISTLVNNVGYIVPVNYGEIIINI